jgi:hypothetical protein
MVIMLCDRTDRMRRRHVRIDGVKHIGKETDEVEETEIVGLDKDSYVEYRAEEQRISVRRTVARPSASSS